MNVDPEDEAEYWPWRCPCGRLNKKLATECVVCYGPWTAGTRHRTQPRTYTTSDWKASASTWKEWGNWEEWEDASSRSSSRYRYGEPGQSPKARTQQTPAVKGQGKGKKGKAKGKSKSQGKTEQVSPFQQEGPKFAPWASLDSSKLTPTSTLAPSPFASLTMTEKQEWAEQLRKAYPDPTTMPEDTKALLDKADQETGRLGIKNLHQATKHLGKAKKHLAEVMEQKRVHRSLWMTHLSNGVQMWEQQLKDFQQHQTMLTEQAGKARVEITSTSHVIQQLSSTAGSTAPPPSAPAHTETEDGVEEAADKEEEKMRKHLQGVLRNCANSLGLDLVNCKESEGLEDEENTMDEADKRAKRPRSLEPFGGSGKKTS